MASFIEKSAFKMIIIAVLLAGAIGVNFVYLDLNSNQFQLKNIKIDNAVVTRFDSLGEAYYADDQEMIEQGIQKVIHAERVPHLRRTTFFFLGLFFLIPITAAGALMGTLWGFILGLVSTGIFAAMITMNQNLESMEFVGDHWAVFATYMLAGTLVGFLADRKFKAQEQGFSKYKEDFLKLQAKHSQVATSEEQLQDQVKKSEKKIFRLSNFVTMFYNLSKEMSSALELQHVLENISKAIIKLLDAERAEVLLFERGYLKPKVYFGWDGEEDVINNVSIPIGEGVIGWVAQTRKLLSTMEMKNDYKLASIPQHDIIRSVLCAPLVYGNDLLGVINIGRLKSGQVSQEETRLLYILASMAAMAINNAKLFERIRELANVDGLTQLFCNRYFQEHLIKEIKRSQRYNDKFSIIMTDIDHFKNFNDKYGHQIGDMVLAETAHILQNNIREDIDLAARYGGEEFIVLLPKTDQQGAYIFAERVRKEVADATYTDPELDEELKVTISLGISTFPDHSTDKDELIRLADQALYISKTSGRNRTTTCPGKAKVKRESSDTTEVSI